MTEFGAWLEVRRISINSAADRLGISRRVLQRYIWAEKFPTLPDAAKIEDFTEGAITFRTWLEPYRG